MGPILTAALNLVKGKGDGSLIEKIGDAVDKNFTSKREIEEKYMEILLEEKKLEQELMLGQISINKVEASHPSIFVAGWRPAIGWVCASVFAINFIFIPVYCTLVETLSLNAVCPETLDMSQMMPVVLGMLGIGGMRTYEKYKKVDTRNTK
jgi:hypothetical protein